MIKKCYNLYGDSMKYKNSIFIGILVFIVVVQIIMLAFQKEREVEVYSKNLMYMDTHIGIQVFNVDEQKANEVLDKANTIFSEYHDLSTRFEANNYNNVFYINNGLSSEEYIIIDERLYSMIEYGKELYYQSNGIKNINFGNVIDVWSDYRKSMDGIPTNVELEEANTSNIEDIVLKDGNKIKNNDVNIDLGSVAKGYAVEVVGEMFREEGVKSFLINAGGNVLVGDHHSGDKFTIGLQDPDEQSGIFDIVKGENIAVVTSGGYQRYYEVDGINYGHIIDPSTLYPANENKSVTVITDCSKKADGLALTLFVMNATDGIEYLKYFENVEAIWVTNTDDVIKTEGFSKYEL